MRWRIWRNAVVVREKRASRIRGEGLGLGRVRKKHKMILRVSNIERLEPAKTCSSWSEVDVRMEDEFVDGSRYRAMVAH